MSEPSPTAPTADSTPSPEVDADARELLARAEGEAQAALALLFDVAAPIDAAADHVREGFGALARLARHRARAPELEADADEIDDAGQALRTHAPAWVGARTELALAAVASPEAPAGSASGDDPRRALTEHARGLVDAVRAAEADLYGALHRRGERLAWRRRVGMALLALVPVVVLLVLFPPDYREGPWRAQYFENRTFEGEPHVRRDGDLRFKWDDSSPLYDVPEDGFSARWDTCLELDRAYEIAFQLVSDDGSRLFVNDELVIDNWGTHAERSRGGKVALEPGLHHLRVDYFEAKHSAMVSLAASLRGERPDSLPTRMLHYPGDEIDDDDPCAAVRAARP